jgi:hypothetical protein
MILTILSLQSAQAYSSSDGTIVINKRPKRKALLDYKFVIMQSRDNEAFASTQEYNNDSQGLNTLSTAPKQMPVIKHASPSSAKATPKAETWDDYAEEVEMDESLGVSAKIRN